ncbi:MAG: hypothetical protein P1U84_03985, partial [Parvibaculaceae bacterium]|nr:hypothetical protein [Parvibaculaceae bacterium]
CKQDTPGGGQVEEGCNASKQPKPSCPGWFRASQWDGTAFACGPGLPGTPGNDNWGDRAPGAAASPHTK